MRDMLDGHPLRRGSELREVLGHSPAEALAGLVFGMGVAQIFEILMGS
jgi:acid phosphatase family membrane protein YuiD